MLADENGKETSLGFQGRHAAKVATEIMAKIKSEIAVMAERGRTLNTKLDLTPS